MMNGDLNLEETSRVLGREHVMDSILSESLSDMSSLDDAVNTVKTLLEENAQLKRTLNESKDSMRVACQTMDTWQQTWQTERQQYNEKSKEAKTMIASLKETVANRDKTIETILQQARHNIPVSSADEFATHPPESDVPAPDANHVAQLCEQLRHALDHLQTVTAEKSELVAMNNDLMVKLHVLNGDCVGDTAVSAGSEDAASSMEYVVVPSEEDGAERRVKVTKSAGTEAAGLEASQLVQSVGVKEMLQKLQEDQHNIDVLKAQLASTQDQLAVAQQQSVDKSSKVKDLQRALDASVAECQRLQAELESKTTSMSKAHQELVDDMETKMSGLSIMVQTDVTNDQMAALRSENDALRIQLSDANETQTANLELIKQLQAALAQQQEKLFSFQTQAEVYKADFEAERRARESLNDDVLKLEEQLQVRLMRDTTGGATGQQPTCHQFVCPKCAHRAVDVYALQVHCETCIE